MIARWRRLGLGGGGSHADRRAKSGFDGRGTASGALGLIEVEVRDGLGIGQSRGESTRTVRPSGVGRNGW